MHQQFLILDPARSEPDCPVCGDLSRYVGSRAGLDTYECTDPACGLRWNVHDPSVMTPPRKREAGPRQARPSVNRRYTDPDQRDPRRGGSIHV
jgi:hypothetical protein